MATAILQAVNEKDACVIKLLQTAYYIAKEELPISKYDSLLELMEMTGSDLGALQSGYTSRKTADGLLSAISECIDSDFGYPRLYVGWRIFWALYHIVWIIITGVYSYQWLGPDPKHQVKWFIFITDWAYFTLTMATITDACAVIYVHVRRKDILSGTCHEVPWYMKAAWCMTTMASVTGTVVTIAYWGILTGREITAVDLETHALNTVYIVLNLMVTGMPIRLLHVWFSVVFGVAYIFFTLFYYLAGGTNAYEKPYIYSVIDWRKPGTAVAFSVVVGIVAIAIMHLVIYGLYCLKLYIHVCCKREESYSLDEQSYTGKEKEVDPETVL